MRRGLLHRRHDARLFEPGMTTCQEDTSPHVSFTERKACSVGDGAGRRAFFHEAEEPFGGTARKAGQRIGRGRGQLAEGLRGEIGGAG